MYPRVADITFDIQFHKQGMVLRKDIFKVAAAGLLVVNLNSCNRHFSVQKNEYKEYEIGSGTGVDSSLVKYYTPYKQQMEAEMNRVIGQTEVAITKPSTPETLLGNFFSEAMLSEGQKLDPSIQFTFATKGGLRLGFPKGDIKVSDVFELMPFENEMVVLTLSGADVQKLINFIAKKDGEPIAGMRMKLKNNVAYDIKIQDKPFDLNKNYKLLTYDYLANSGDDLACLSNPIDRKNVGKKVRDALMDYIGDQTKNGKKINPQLDGRIVVTNE